MDCTQFLSEFSDFRDGLLDDRRAALAERHLADCRSCRRYRRVVDDGVRALRTAPAVRLDHDFRPRLRHRIYHLEDAGSPDVDSAGSGVSAAVVFGMAALLALAAWSPVLRGPEPGIRLPAVVVSEPPRPRHDPILARPPLVVEASPVRWADGWNPGPSWERPAALLLEYSPLYRRYRSRARPANGLD